MEMSVTLLWIYNDKKGENITSFWKTAEFKKDTKEQGIENLHRIKGILLKKGMENSKIELKTVDCNEKSHVSDQVVEELNSGRYDTVLVSKHDVTRAEELFFGDTAISIIRKSPIPVLVAKGAGSSG